MESFDGGSDWQTRRQSGSGTTTSSWTHGLARTFSNTGNDVWQVITPGTTFGVAFHIQFNGGSYPDGVNFARHLCGWDDDITNAAAELMMTVKGDGAIEFRRTSGTGTLVASTAAGVINGGDILGAGAPWYHIEVEVKVHASTGTIKLRVNGATPSGWSDQTNVNTGAAATVQYIKFSGNNGIYNMDDLVIYDPTGGVNDTFPLGQLIVEELRANGNGNYSQLTGSDGNSTDNYLLVDEDTPSLSDYNGSATAGNKDTYAMENLVTITTVIGLEIRLHTFKSDTGTKQFRRVLRHSATDNNGADQALSVDPGAMYVEVFDTDPIAAGAWTPTNVNAMEVGFEVRT
jgi:hypothetical protein